MSCLTADGSGRIWAGVEDGVVRQTAHDWQVLSVRQGLPASRIYTVRPDAELQVFLQDPSGILTTGHSPQNAIVVTLDENTTTRSALGRMSTLSGV